MLKFIVWVVEIGVAVAQFYVITFDPINFNPVGFWQEVMLLVIVFEAPIIIALILLLIFMIFGARDLDDEKHHMGLSIISMTIITTLICIYFAFSKKGFGGGLSVSLAYVFFAVITIYLGSRFLDYGYWNSHYGGTQPSNTSSLENESFIVDGRGNPISYIDGGRISDRYHGNPQYYIDGNRISDRYHGNALYYIEGDRITERYGGPALYYIKGNKITDKYGQVYDHLPFEK